MLRMICGTTVLLLSIFTCFAQGSSVSPEKTEGFERLNLNAAVPKLSSQAMNFSHPTIEPLSGSQKLVILDFWATWCTSCISQFPKLDSLQKLEKDDLKIVLVNASDDSLKIRTFLQKYNLKNRPLSLPTILNEPGYYSMFPHNAIPHYVWILNGKFLATSGPEALSGANIRAVLQDAKINFRMKNDVLDYDPNSALLINRNGGSENNFEYRSLFTKELDGLSDGYHTSGDSIHQRLVFTNFSARHLYSIILKIPKKLIKLKDMDAESAQIFYKDLYSYELTVPVKTSPEKSTTMMIDDLDRYFEVKSNTSEKRQTVYKLKLRKKARLQNNDTASMQIQNDDDKKIVQYSNIPVRILVSDLNFMTENRDEIPRIVDATKYSGAISLVLPMAASMDFETIKQSLKQQGFNVKKGKRRLRSCILTPRN